MESLGIAPFKWYQSVDSGTTLESRITPTQGVETYNTEVIHEQSSTTVKSAEVLNQAVENASTGLPTTHFGSFIGLTV